VSSLERAVVSILETDPAIAAAAPGGVWPHVLPPAVDFPALRFTTVSARVLMQTDGPTNTSAARIQIDSFAQSWEEAKALEIAVVSALCPTPNVRRVVEGMTVDGIVPEVGRSRYETNSSVYMFSRDFIVWGGPVLA
jgi:hypothetical protein